MTTFSFVEAALVVCDVRIAGVGVARGWRSVERRGTRTESLKHIKRQKSVATWERGSKGF